MDKEVFSWSWEREKGEAFTYFESVVRLIRG